MTPPCTRALTLTAAGRLTLFLALLTAPCAPALATPVFEFECSAFSTVPPIPSGLIDPNFTIRRHFIEVDPYEEFVNEAWSLARFLDAGSFEVEVRPLEGDAQFEPATSFRTAILDGRDNVVDELRDTVLATGQAVSIGGYTVIAYELVLSRIDGTALNTHLRYPADIDLEDYEQKACTVFFRSDTPIPCPGNPGLQCTDGYYAGQITGISTAPHDEDHGGFTINAGLNDAWVTAQAPFQGLFITVYPELGLVFVAWFTFEVPGMEAATTLQSLREQGLPAVFGGEKQRWVTAVGSYSGNRAELNMELTSGGLFNASEPLPEQDTDYGTMVLEFDGCETGTVTFDVPSAELSGTFPIGRVVDSNVALCEALAAE